MAAQRLEKRWANPLTNSLKPILDKQGNEREEGAIVPPFMKPFQIELTRGEQDATHDKGYQKPIESLARVLAAASFAQGKKAAGAGDEEEEGHAP